MGVQSDWPTHSEVSKTLGVSITQVRRLRKEGTIRGEQDSAGIWRFDPASVAAHAKERPTMGPLIESASAEGLQDLFGVLLRFTESLFARYEAQDIRRQDYITKLEESNLAMRGAAETALSQEQERLIIARKAEHDMQVKDRVIQSLTELGLPMLVHQVEEHFKKTNAAATGGNGVK
jgi:hypothetical protein